MNMKKRSLKIIAYILTVCMVMTMSPVTTFALENAGSNQNIVENEVQENDVQKTNVQDNDIQEEALDNQQLNGSGNNVVVQYREPAYYITGVPKSGIYKWYVKSCGNYTKMNDSTDSLSTGWYVVDSNVSIDDELYIGGNVNIIICKDKKLYVEDNVRVPESSSLTIYRQADDNDNTCKLEIAGKYKCAGIGGESGETNGPITINGGTISAIGGKYAAGIGGGDGGFGKNIVINDGNIKGLGNKNQKYQDIHNGGAGIGGGDDRTGSDIVINGGTVEAKGTRSASAIGGGDGGSGDRITINGGKVTATGSYGGASIGGGRNEAGKDITINGGEVTAVNKFISKQAQGGGAGIGGGANSTGGNIKITGGTVLAIGDTGGSGIGGGDDGTGEYISITGGKVKAEGYARLSEGAAGIGGGRNRDGKYITISGGNVEVHGTYGGAGIGGGQSGFGTNIEITGGNVNANGGKTGAGIGGGEDRSGQNITIAGGTVYANGGSSGGAGIGGGQGGSGDNITIKEGQVYAYGSSGGAGIGGGQSEFGTYIKITAGKVEANGGKTGAGIGGGEDRSGQNITISGGSVTANGGSSGGAGIGGGQDGSGDNITIEGGSVYSNGGSDAAGIGGGEGQPGNTIKITGGTVKACGNGNGAGIGGGEESKGVNITVSGGNIKAYGGYEGAGIGGGSSGKGESIRIIGGTVEAYGGSGGGAGIGGGYEENADGIYFSDCIVIAAGYGNGKAIGSAKGAGKSNNIRMNAGLYLNGRNMGGFNNDWSELIFLLQRVRITKSTDPAGLVITRNGDSTKEQSDHNWTLVADGPVITATCSNDDHESFSPEQVTLCEPENPIYDGNSKEVRVNGAIDGVYNDTSDEEAGEESTPEVKYYRNGKLLTEAPTEVGTYIAKLTLGEGEGAATAELAFCIERGDIEDCKITMTPASFTFNNKVKNPKVTVKNIAGNTLQEGHDYTVTVNKGKNVGTYKVTVKGKGDYNSWKVVSYKINPAPKAIKSIKRGKNAITVKWAKGSKAYRAQITGYQIKYSTSSTFKNAKTVTVNGKYTSKTIKKLKSNKKYYVKMRTYKTVNGKKYWSTWSKVKTAKTR